MDIDQKRKSYSFNFKFQFEKFQNLKFSVIRTCPYMRVTTVHIFIVCEIVFYIYIMHVAKVTGKNDRKGRFTANNKTKQYHWYTT